MVLSSPAIADNRIYIGSSDHYIYSLNASTGALIWSFQTADMVLESSPAVADGKLYIGSWDRHIYCLNASSGDLIWKFKTGDSVVSSPSVADGKVYVGSYDHYVYSFGSAVPFHDISIISVKPTKTAVGQNYSLAIDVTIDNRGGFTESFNVTARANGTILQTETVTLENGTETVVSLTWNTTGFSMGNYFISTNATTVFGETFTLDNTLQQGEVTISISGDINGDGIVDISDASLVGGYWQTTVPPAPSNVDINGDNSVDIGDAAIIGGNWQKTI
jgi:outer membrane protein assembly factor BamB